MQYIVLHSNANKRVLEILKHGKIWETICISVPCTPNSAGAFSSPTPSRVIYSHAHCYSLDLYIIAACNIHVCPKPTLMMLNKRQASPCRHRMA